MNTSSTRLILIGGMLVTAGAMSGCDSHAAGGTYEVPGTRTHDEIRRGTQATGSDARRFGLQRAPMGMPGMGSGGDPHAGMDMGAAHGAPSNPFLWDLPEGWASIPGSSMRQGNFKVIKRPEIECYLAILPGKSGGVEANVNRWRGQIGLEAI
ncbi:MAG: hypothetical protein ACYTG4_06600, partial [Planctomycetota bacterium]